MSRGESHIFQSNQGSTAFDVLATWPPYPPEGIDFHLAADCIAAAFRDQKESHSPSAQSEQDGQLQPSELQPKPYNAGQKDFMVLASRVDSPSTTVKSEDTPGSISLTSNSPTSKLHIIPYLPASSSSSVPRSIALHDDGDPSKSKEGTSRRKPRRSPIETASGAHTNSRKTSPASRDASRDASDKRRSCNRIAAIKSRRRKKQADDELADQEHILRCRNRQLAADAAELRDQVFELKNEILSHGACDSQLINDYLANEAKRFLGEGPGERDCLTQTHMQGNGRHKANTL